MKLKTFFSSQKTENGFILSGQELLHCRDVFRCRVGELINVVCSDKFIYICEIKTISKTELFCEIVEKKENFSNPKCEITVFQSLLKGDKLEILVKNLTEIGVSKLCFVASENIVKQGDIKIEKLNKIAIESAKQSGRSSGVEILKTLKLQDVLKLFNQFDLVLFAHEKSEDIKLKNLLKAIKQNFKIAVLIGPEGGFSDNEAIMCKNAGAKVFGLGKRVLRAETAANVVSTIVLYELGEFD